MEMFKPDPRVGDDDEDEDEDEDDDMTEVR